MLVSQLKLSVLSGVAVKVISKPLFSTSPALMTLELNPEVLDTGKERRKGPEEARDHECPRSYAEDLT